LHAKNILGDPRISGYFRLQTSRIKNILDQTGFFNMDTENIPDITDTSADIYFENKILNIDSIHASLFNGSLNGKATINLETSQPS